MNGIIYYYNNIDTDCAIDIVNFEIEINLKRERCDYFSSKGKVFFPRPCSSKTPPNSEKNENNNNNDHPCRKYCSTVFMMCQRQRQPIAKKEIYSCLRVHYWHHICYCYLI